MPRNLAILPAILAAVLLVACGSEDEQPSADAGELLAKAFDAPVESGRMSLTAELQVDGIPAFGDGIEIQLNGPFTKTSADLDVSVGGFGPGLAGGLTFAEDNVWLSVGGRAYEVGEELIDELNGDIEEQTGRDAGSLTLASLGIDIESWLADPRVEGDEEVSGEPVTKVVSTLDASKVLADLNAFAGSTSDTELSGDELELFAGFAEDSTVDVYVSKVDGTIRRVALELEFEVPEEARGDFGGAEGGAAAIDVTFTDIGEPQRIEPPADARPLEDLLRQFGLGPELLLQ
ncbi:MAG: hypothetical protein WD844_10075 [Thermoleophilaceae bacterium]